MKELKDFISRVIAKKNKTITDEVFLSIQNDKELMQEYLHLVEKKGLQTVNQQIGKGVKEKYSLENHTNRNDTPISTLISSYQEFQ